ncbi:hypothetical protein JJB99_32885 [Bradyrhizobium diazoefficiens]|uniref:hypothetical protein n=1 Tax=Bradyrhizobium diazoefficiens TaxID=1355477 RepID=UPI001909500B|nr:hypothetical protein [Bradyrhizobium diazoefficiens]QQO14055.1 hypothetical protein JJB99_32885 [Bradyrhizobium diazoefficiens]
MSDGQRLSASDQGAAWLQLQRLGRMFVLILLGTLVAGYLAMLAFSASGCFLSQVVRCFSISRDLIGFSWFALKALSLPTVIAAVLVTIILQIRGFLVWWNILSASFISALATGLISRVSFLSGDVFFIFVLGLILFAGAQASLLIRNRLDRSSI